MKENKMPSIELNEEQLELMPFVALHQLMRDHPNKELVSYLHRHFLRSRHAEQYTKGAWEFIGLTRATRATATN